MALPKKLTFKDVALSEGTTSIGATPVAAVVVAPCAGILVKVAAAAGGTTTGTIDRCGFGQRRRRRSGGLLSHSRPERVRANGVTVELAKNGAARPSSRKAT
jgi:hypothetical protein